MECEISREITFYKFGNVIWNTSIHNLDTEYNGFPKTHKTKRDHLLALMKETEKLTIRYMKPDGVNILGSLNLNKCQFKCLSLYFDFTLYDDTFDIVLDFVSRCQRIRLCKVRGAGNFSDVITMDQKSRDESKQKFIALLDSVVILSNMKNIDHVILIHNTHKDYNFTELTGLEIRYQHTRQINTRYDFLAGNGYLRKTIII